MKTVTEQQFKFFLTKQDGLADSNYFLEVVEYEGHPPEFVQSKTLKGNFRLKNFPRSLDGVKFSEQAYLKSF